MVSSNQFLYEPGSINKLVVLGMGTDLPPLMTEIIISWGPKNPYGIGLMSLSPIFGEIMGVIHLKDSESSTLEV